MKVTFRWSGLYLQASGQVQRHLLYGGSGEGLEAFRLPLLNQVVERLLAAVFHGQALGPILGCGESTEA